MARRTKAQITADENIAKEKAAEQAALDASEAESKGEADSDGGEGQGVQQYTPPQTDQDAAVNDERQSGTHFCSRYPRYRVFGVQFENNKVVIQDTKLIKKLKECKPFGNEFWICNKAG